MNHNQFYSMNRKTAIQTLEKDKKDTIQNTTWIQKLSFKHNQINR